MCTVLISKGRKRDRRSGATCLTEGGNTCTSFTWTSEKRTTETGMLGPPRMENQGKFTVLQPFGWMCCAEESSRLGPLQFHPPWLCWGHQKNQRAATKIQGQRCGWDLQRMLVTHVRTTLLSPVSSLFMFQDSLPSSQTLSAVCWGLTLSWVAHS